MAACMNDHTESSPLSETLGSVTDNILLGRYDVATKALECYLHRVDLSPEDAALVSRAAARIYVAKGYPQAAKDVISWAIKTYNTKLTPDLRLELDFHAAYCSIVGCGELHNAYPAISKVAAWLETENVESFDSRMIEFQTFLHKILLVQQTLNQPKGRDVRPGIAERAKALMQLAEQRKHHIDLWRSFVVFGIVASNDEVLRWLEVSILYDWLPDSVRAQLQLETAQKLIQAGRTQEADDLFSICALTYRRCEHAYGEIEIRRLRLQHGLDRSPNPLKELVDIVVDYCKADFPYGVLHAAPAPLSLAFAQSKMDVYISLQECFHTVCNETGITHERLLLDIQLLAGMNATTGYFANVIHLGRHLYEECNRLGYWTMSWLVGRVLSLAYFSRRQYPEALQYATEVQAICTKKSLKASSEAAYHLAFIKGGQRSDLTAQRLLETADIVEELSATIEEDEQIEDPKLTCDKLLLILGFQYEQARLSPDNYVALNEAADLTSSKAEALSKALAAPESVQVEGACKEHRITQLLFEAKCAGQQHKVTSAIDLCTGLIEAYDSVGLQYHAAIKYQFRSACHTQLYQMELDLGTRLKHLVAAEVDLEKASQCFIALASLQQVLIARHGQARIHVTAWETVNTPVDDALHTLSILENVADALRKELSAFGNLNALRQKQSFSAMTEVRDLYRWATAIAVTANRPSDLFVWSQKRKARSLSEILGLGVLIPTNAQRADGEDGEVQVLFDQLRALTATSLTCQANEQVYVRQRIEGIEVQLRNCPQRAVRDFLILRDGVVSNINEVSELAAAIPTSGTVRDIIFADYVTHGDDIYLTTLNIARPEESCRLQRLVIAATDVRDWIRNHFATDSKRKETLRHDINNDPSKPMRVLDALVTPLKDFTKAGDLLLISSTGLLAGLPLHTLCVKEDEDGEYVPLIERNPVVYIPSLPIGKICLNRWQGQRQRGKAQFFGNYDKPSEAARIYAQIAKLAETVPGHSFYGESATKMAYMDNVAGASLIHHHLHCRFSADNILKQALVLAKEPIEGPDTAVGSNIVRDSDAPDRHYNEAILSAVNQVTQSLQVLKEDAQSELLLSSSSDIDASTHLTVEDIFNLKLSSPLVVLIACESSSQTYSEGDEPLGLVTGFLCAGAASVIGASWPIPSGAGRKFSEIFYEQISKSTSGDVVDLAVALQEAVLTIKDDENMTETYYWGGFCLYGSWLFRPPWITNDLD